MKKITIGVVTLFVVLAVLLQLRSVQALLIDWYLPDFPRWPQPVAALTETTVDGEIYYATASPFDLDVIFGGMAHATPTTGLGYLSIPAVASAEQPVPAMVILPGSGGIAPGREREYAKLLNAHGIAAFVVEYYLPRGMTPDLPYMVRTSAVTEFDVITDAYAALTLLSTSPRIDPRRIGLMGFSYGGMVARFAMDDRFRQVLAKDSAGFALHVDFYGPCFQNLQTAATNLAPLLTLRGSADRSNDLTACAARDRELAALGVRVDAEVFPGAGHAWENATPRHTSESPYISGCEIRYDAQGFSWLNGERIANVATDAGRGERIAARLTSGGKYDGCLYYGYTVGRDEVATQRGYAELLRFLKRHFHLELDVAGP